MRKEIRRIKFTGKNLNDVFALPCVRRIIKFIDQPRLVIYTNFLSGNPLMDVAKPGDELVEYSDGKWDIQYGDSDE